MNGVDIERALKSMSIIVDTREQQTERSRKRYADFAVPYVRAALSYGDYTWNAEIDGTPVFDTSETILPMCVIERKMSIDELASCFTHSRDRFEREFMRADATGAKVFLLIENCSWEKILRHQYNSLMSPKALVASLIAFCIRYNITPIFCTEMTTGAIIKEILYRDLKERLTRGNFDAERLGKDSQTDS